MNKDIKLRLLLVPLIFMVMLFVPGLLAEVISYMPERPEVIQITFGLILVAAMLIWCFTFDYIPIGVYIAMLTVYTIISWAWILRKKKGNAMYFIVWLILCASSILMYWKWGIELYAIMLRM